MEILSQQTAVLSIVAVHSTDSMFWMNFECEPVNTLRIFCEELISTKARVPIVPQTKPKKQ